MLSFLIVLIVFLLLFVGFSKTLHDSNNYGKKRGKTSKIRRDYDNYGGNPDKVFEEFNKKGKRKPYVSKSSDIDVMEGHDFEYFCADILRKNDFSDVEVTKGSGDYGIDIIAKKDKVTYAIQCKRYNGNVGNKAVQEAFSGKAYYGCDRAVVLTNSFFTEQAKETALRTDVLLWDRNKLTGMISVAEPHDDATESISSENERGRKSSFHLGWILSGFFAIGCILFLIFVVAKH